MVGRMSGCGSYADPGRGGECQAAEPKRGRKEHRTRDGRRRGGVRGRIRKREGRKGSETELRGYSRADVTLSFWTPLDQTGVRTMGMVAVRFCEVSERCGCRCESAARGIEEQGYYRRAQTAFRGRWGRERSRNGLGGQERMVREQDWMGPSDLYKRGAERRWTGLDPSKRVHDPKTFNRSSAAASSADRDQLLQFVLSQTPVPRSDLFVAATDVGE